MKGLAVGLACGLACILLACASSGDGEGKRVQNGKADAPGAAMAPSVDAPAPAPQVPESEPAAEVASAQGETGQAPSGSPESDRKANLLKLLEYDPEDPLGNLEEADRLAGDATGLAMSDGSPCRLDGMPVRLFADPLRVALTAAGDRFVAAAYETGKGKEQVRLVEVPKAGLPRPLQAFDLPVVHAKARVAPPGLSARDNAQVSVAMTDGSGALLVAEVLLGKARIPAPMRRVHDGLDTRFAPAVAHSGGGTIVAFTLGTTPMKLMVARVPASDTPPSLTDVTPVGLSGSSPVFVAGQNPPTLVALDARAAISHVVRVLFDQEGVPKVGTIVGPVGLTATPSQLAAAHNGKGVQVGYMAVGNGATTAVGIVDLAPFTPPTALVKGTAYGPLYLSALTLPEGALFASDTPQKPGKDPTHDISLTLNRRAAVPATGTLLAGPAGASGAALALRSDGTVGLAYTTAEGTYLALLQCR